MKAERSERVYVCVCMRRAVDEVYGEDNKERETQKGSEVGMNESYLAKREQRRERKVLML